MSETGSSHHEPRPAAAGQLAVNQWDGSPEGKAYSEFNHHMAGMFVLLIGMSELRQSLVPLWLAWSRFLLPVAMLGVGGFLLVWSDHEAWPVGSLSLLETFSGRNMETLQHKVYGLLLLGVGIVELVRRTRRVEHAVWKIPFPALAISGGLMLFLHSHGSHPAAHKIMIHHTILAVLALTAGVCKLMVDWSDSQRPVLASLPMGNTPTRLNRTRSRWAVVWSGLILLIGFHLLAYTE